MSTVPVIDGIFLSMSPVAYAEMTRSLFRHHHRYRGMHIQEEVYEVVDFMSRAWMNVDDQDIVLHWRSPILSDDAGLKAIHHFLDNYHPDWYCYIQLGETPEGRLVKGNYMVKSTGPSRQNERSFE